MSKKSAVFVLATSMSASVQLAEAQAPAKVPRIGYLAPRSAVPKESVLMAASVAPPVNF